MSTRLNICSVNVLDNPAKLTDPFRIEITFEVYEDLPEDVEWELVYVASCGMEEHDKSLESVLIGPIKEGRHKFVLEAEAPKVETLTEEDLIETNALLLKVRYNGQMFVKVGWVIGKEYTDPETAENPPETPDPSKLLRKVQTDDARVTTYAINWDNMPDAPVEGGDATEMKGPAEGGDATKAESPVADGDTTQQESSASGGGETTQMEALTVADSGKENVDSSAAPVKEESKNVEGSDLETGKDVEMTPA